MIIDYLQMIFIEIWNVLCEMSPYLLFGFLIAGILSVLISRQLVEKHLGEKGITSVVKASLIGIPLPLCSCSVIPVATSLKKSGASNSATSSFLISTPQTGIDSIFVTYALLGPVFAIFKPVAAFLSGILGGVLVSAFAREKDFKQLSNNCPECKEKCSVPEKSKNKIKDAFYHGFVTLPADIAKPLIIGLLIAGIMSALLPDNFFADTIGTGFVAMLVVLLFSIPFYVCATASVPVAAALIATGISPGAALVFLMAGPATNAATITTIWKIMGRTTAAIYLIVTALTAIVSGILLDKFFHISKEATLKASHFHGPNSFEILCSILLIIVFAYTFIMPWIQKRKQKTHEKTSSCCSSHNNTNHK